jgi:hypothetical protein
LQAYASKIGAEFRVIRERRFPGWPLDYEKLQIHELAREDGNDWSIYGNARSSVESNGSLVTHSTTPFSAWQLRA